MFQGWWLTVVKVAVLVAVAGLLLWRALQPAVVGFGVGRMIGRLEGARQEAARRGQPVPPGGPQSVGGGS